MSKMHVVQVTKPGGPLEWCERSIPEPPAGMFRIKVKACGICHSDSVVKEGLMPGIQYPRVPGHEVIGIIDAVGAGVTNWQCGARVGIGWHGGHCGQCNVCRRGNFFACPHTPVTGLTYDGGYAEYMLAKPNALALLPDALTDVAAGPLVCAGVTTFNALRHCHAQPGDLVAIQGIGGLGHLAIQYAKKMGFYTVAISRGSDKESLSLQLGADQYINSNKEDAAKKLQNLGGAKIILTTVTQADAMNSIITGLAPNGTLLIVGVPHEPLHIPAQVLIGGRNAVKGWYSGTAIDSEATFAFSQLKGVAAKIETFPLKKADEAYERMISGQSRFRVVLTME